MVHTCSKLEIFALFLAAVVHDLEVYGPYILYPYEEYTMVVVCNYRSYLKRVPFELVLTPKLRAADSQP